MTEIKLIEVKESIFAQNADAANKLRNNLKEKGVYMLNLMSSPGAGKTTTLLRLIDKLKDELRIGVMEADIDDIIDAERIAETGVKTIQLHTGGMCHIDAEMARQGLEELGIEGLDLVVLENVGNLVCPAEFDTGAAENIMILSVPEGDDKPLKYPLMFQVSTLVIINKIDTKSVFDFNDEVILKRIHQRNPKADVMFISAKTGEGFDELCDWIRHKVSEWKK